MASPSSEMIPGLLSLLSTNYANTASSSLVVYDYLLTLHQEIVLVWKQRITPTSILLLSTRAASLLYVILAFTPMTESTKVCMTKQILEDVLDIVIDAQIALFTALRMFVICHSSKYRYILCVVTCMLALMPLAIDIVLAASLRTMQIYPPFRGPPVCGSIIQLPTRVKPSSLVFAARGCLLVADVLIIAMTWTQTFVQWRECIRLHLPLSTSALFIRDGTLYFLALLIITVARMALAPNFQTGAAVSPFFDTLPSILIIRFMLNLRQLGANDSPMASSDTHIYVPFSIPRFASPMDRESSDYGSLDSWVPEEFGDVAESATLEHSDMENELDGGRPKFAKVDLS